MMQLSSMTGFFLRLKSKREGTMQITAKGQMSSRAHYEDSGFFAQKDAPTARDVISLNALCGANAALPPPVIG